MVVSCCCCGVGCVMAALACSHVNGGDAKGTRRLQWRFPGSVGATAFSRLGRVRRHFASTTTAAGSRKTTCPSGYHNNNVIVNRWTWCPAPTSAAAFLLWRAAHRSAAMRQRRGPGGHVVCGLYRYRCVPSPRALFSSAFNTFSLKY